MVKSLWQETVELPNFLSPEGDENTDVLIIGGGICGLLCAYQLKKAGVDCILVESGRIASGTSGNTTAKLTSLHGLIYHELIERLGINLATAYLNVNESAIGEFAAIAEEADCDFRRSTAYTYSLDSADKIEREYRALLTLGADAELARALPLPFEVAAAVGLKDQAEFHPLKLIKHIINGLNIHENTQITRIEDRCAYHRCGKITAGKIIVATHFPIMNKHGLYFLKLYQHRSYVIALENAPRLDGMYVDEDDRGLSFRNYGDLLLIGGGGGRTGKKCGGWNELIAFKNKYYRGSRVKYRWATQDCMSLDKLPLIGRYSRTTPNLYVATGFNKWGMTSSMVAAKILTDMVCGTENAHTEEYTQLFSPSRSILKPQLFVNCAETIANFVYPTTRRCPHLGCALKWNVHEHTWDCPCHGSRFAEDGSLIDDPAYKDM